VAVPLGPISVLSAAPHRPGSGPGRAIRRHAAGVGWTGIRLIRSVSLGGWGSVLTSRTRRLRMSQLMMLGRRRTGRPVPHVPENDHRCVLSDDCGRPHLAALSPCNGSAARCHRDREAPSTSIAVGHPGFGLTASARLLTAADLGLGTFRPGSALICVGNGSLTMVAYRGSGLNP
jgi:hypothetical protein